jgi:hypothetical protein
MLGSSLKRSIANRLAAAAVIVACTSASAFAIDIPVSNGSFETTTGTLNTFTGPNTIAGWTHTFLQTDANSNFVSDDSLGVFTTFGGLGPTNGSQFVVINNTGAGSVVLTTPLIDLQRQFVINGNFSYFTNDSLAVLNRDDFDVVITYFTDATGLTQAQPAITVHLSRNFQGNPIGTTPVATSGPFGPTAFRTASGWTSFNINLNDIGAHTQFVRFQFVVHDNGTENPPPPLNSGVSGVALDNIFINPEPGTMALFALGSLGLGGFAWKRRKLKITKA